LAGGGLVYLPTFIVGEDLRAGRLVCVLEAFVPQDMNLFVLYPQGRYLSPKARAFIDFLTERFAPPAAWDKGF
jgi:DNA-binding transcriptional LysR family regulator